MFFGQSVKGAQAMSPRQTTRRPRRREVNWAGLARARTRVLGRAQLLSSLRRCSRRSRRGPGMEARRRGRRGVVPRCRAGTAPGQLGASFTLGRGPPAPAPIARRVVAAPGERGSNEGGVDTGGPSPGSVVVKPGGRLAGRPLGQLGGGGPAGPPPVVEACAARGGAQKRAEKGRERVGGSLGRVDGCRTRLPPSGPFGDGSDTEGEGGHGVWHRAKAGRSLGYPFFGQV